MVVFASWCRGLWFQVIYIIALGKPISKRINDDAWANSPAPVWPPFTITPRDVWFCFQPAWGVRRLWAGKCVFFAFLKTRISVILISFVFSNMTVPCIKRQNAARRGRQGQGAAGKVRGCQGALHALYPVVVVAAVMGEVLRFETILQFPPVDGGYLGG